MWGIGMVWVWNYLPVLEPPLGLDEGRLITVLVFRVWSATKLAIESINGRSQRIGVSSNEDHVPKIRRAMQLRSSSEWQACQSERWTRQERAMKVAVGDQHELARVKLLGKHAAAETLSSRMRASHDLCAGAGFIPPRSSRLIDWKESHFTFVAWSGLQSQMTSSRKCLFGRLGNSCSSKSRKSRIFSLFLPSAG